VWCKTEGRQCLQAYRDRPESFQAERCQRSNSALKSGRLKPVGITGAPQVDEDQVALAAKLTHQGIFTRAGDPRGALARPAGEKENRIRLGLCRDSGNDDNVERDHASGFGSAIFKNRILAAKKRALMIRKTAGLEIYTTASDGFCRRSIHGNARKIRKDSEAAQKVR
jgi:hypothetical protein